MHPGYIHRAPVSMNTPLRSLAFPGCVTLGKSLPLSEPKVPLLEVQIVKSDWGLGGCAYFWHSGSVATLQKHRHTPPHGLRRHYFASLDPLSPSGQALYSQPHSLLAGFISMALTTASGLVALLACPPPPDQLCLGPSCSLSCPLYS